MTTASPAQPAVESVLQGWEKFATDVVGPGEPLLHDLLRFTYVHAAFDMMARIKAINTAAQQHGDMKIAMDQMNALAREINAFLADEANIPTAMPTEPEPEAPRLILPPNAGRLS